MIAVAQTIIDINAVMIKFLNTSSAYHTVKSPRWFDDLAVEAEIFQIDIPVVTDLEQIDYAEMSLDIARVWAVTYKVENHWQEEKDDSKKTGTIKDLLKLPYKMFIHRYWYLNRQYRSKIEGSRS